MNIRDQKRVFLAALRTFIDHDGWQASGCFHPVTSAAVVTLDLTGDATAVVTAAWRFVERVTAAGVPCRHDAHARIKAADGDFELVAHRVDLRLERKVEFSATPATISAPAHLGPATCEPRPARRPWADDERVGSIYVSRQPDGAARVALVMTVDGVARQVSASSGLLPEDVEPAIQLCAKRLAGEVLRRSSVPEKTGAP